MVAYKIRLPGQGFLPRHRTATLSYDASRIADMESNSSSPDASIDAPESRRRGRIRRWLLLAAGLALLLAVMREVLFPFRGQDYLEISHGDHSHYVPKDRDPDVSISNFPTSPPGPGERILPDGRVERE